MLRSESEKEWDKEWAVYLASLSINPPDTDILSDSYSVGEAYEMIFVIFSWKIILHAVERIVLLDKVLASACVAHTNKNPFADSVAESESSKVGVYQVCYYSLSNVPSVVKGVLDAGSLLKSSLFAAMFGV